MYPRTFHERRFVQAAGLISLTCLLFLFVRTLATGSVRYWFIPENLVLAWLSLIFAWVLIKNLKYKRWSSWQNLGLSALWLFFLPNSWYVLTDFIHVSETGEISEIYDITMICLLVIAGFALGFASLYLVHKEMRKRWASLDANVIVGIIIFLCSFAIYLGRDLRWSSWDVVAHPTGIILNVTDRIIDPLGHPRALNTTALFFIFISVLYMCIWLFIPPEEKHKRQR
jgi:uncharacterized membrane protein